METKKEYRVNVIWHQFFGFTTYSIVTCAIIMKPYVELNISRKSHTTIKYFLKMLR